MMNDGMTIGIHTTVHKIELLGGFVYFDAGLFWGDWNHRAAKDGQASLFVQLIPEHQWRKQTGNDRNFVQVNCRSSWSVSARQNPTSFDASSRIKRTWLEVSNENPWCSSCSIKVCCRPLKWAGLDFQFVSSIDRLLLRFSDSVIILTCT